MASVSISPVLSPLDFYNAAIKGKTERLTVRQLQSQSTANIEPPERIEPYVGSQYTTATSLPCAQMFLASKKDAADLGVYLEFVNGSDSCNTPLLLAVRNGHLATVKLVKLLAAMRPANCC